MAPDTLDEEIARVWEVEARRRVGELRSGVVRPVDGRETLAMARAELTKRRA